MADNEKPNNTSPQADQQEEVKVTSREEVNQLDQSYWGIVKRQFKKNRLAVWSLRSIVIIFFIGLLSNFIANDKPLVCKYNGKTYFPAFKERTIQWGLGKWDDPKLNSANWHELELGFAIWPIIPWSATSADDKNYQYIGPFDQQVALVADQDGRLDSVSLPYKQRKYVYITYADGSTEQVKIPAYRKIFFNEFNPEFKAGDTVIDGLESSRFRHWAGTDQLGRDVMAGMVHGTWIAVLVGIISMTVAAIIGILFGSLAGYFGDSRLKLSRGAIIMNLIFLVLGFFYAFISRKYAIAEAFEAGTLQSLGAIGFSFVIFLAVMAVGNVLAKLMNGIPFLGKQVPIPMDILVSRLIEVLRSIPGLLLILSVVAILEKPSLFAVMAIIGVLGWTGIARFMRAELLRVRSLEYIEAAQSLGFKEFRIIMKHAIPNALTPVLISIAFGVASAILTESFLSFLGIGVPVDVITWGKLLSLAREAPKAWWLAILPGFAIFITVTLYNLLGEGLTDALDPKMKQ